MIDSPGPLAKVQVLGPVTVTLGTVEVRLSRLQRHRVAAMAVEPGRVVSVDVLCEALWGGDQPRAGRDRTGEGNVLVCLAQTLRRQGRREEMALRYHEAAEILTEIDDLLSLCVVETALARIGMQDGDLAAARRHAEKALELAESLYYPLGMKFALHTMGEVQLYSGDLLGARQTLRTAEEYARPLSGAALASVLHMRGKTEAALGDRRLGRSFGQEALDLYTAMKRPEAEEVRAFLDTLAGESQ